MISISTMDLYLKCKLIFYGNFKILCRNKTYYKLWKSYRIFYTIFYNFTLNKFYQKIFRYIIMLILLKLIYYNYFGFIYLYFYYKLMASYILNNFQSHNMFSLILNLDSLTAYNR